MKRFANLSFAALAAACALVAVLGAVRTAGWGDGWIRFWIVVLPALAAVLFAALLLIRPATRINVLLATLSSGFAVYMVEAALRLRPEPMPGDQWQEAEQRKAAAREELAFDERTAEQLLHDLRAAGVDAWSTVPADQLLGVPILGEKLAVTVNGEPILPLAGISSARIDHCRESGRYPVQTTDAYGFVNPPEAWDGDVDVVAIGDSFVHGMCTEASESIVAHIRTGRPNALSVGIGGWGPLFMLAGLAEYAAHLRPEHVLWFYYEGNDLLNLQDERRHPILARYRNPEFRQNLMDLRDSVDASLRAFVERVVAASENEPAAVPAAPPVAADRGLHLIASVKAFVTIYETRTLLGLTDLAKQESILAQLEPLAEVLEDAKRITESWGGTLHFVYLPRSARYSSPLAIMQLPQLRARDRVLERVTRLGLPIVDVDSAFRVYGNPQSLFFYPESHYNGAGNRLVAESVLRHLGRWETAIHN